MSKEKFEQFQKSFEPSYKIVVNELKELAANHPKLQKALAIFDQTVSFAQQTVKDFGELARYERKIPRILRKKKYSRREAKRLRLLALINHEMMRRQHIMLVSQPIRKIPFDAAGKVLVTPAIVDETSAEVIVNNSGKLEIKKPL
jgi:hypothetical protein